MMRADVMALPQEASYPMSTDRMLEFYKKLHGASVYTREDGRQWIEWSLEHIRKHVDNQPKYLQRIAAQYC